jgi:hypothetical protein
MTPQLKKLLTLGVTGLLTVVGLAGLGAYALTGTTQAYAASLTYNPGDIVNTTAPLNLRQTPCGTVLKVVPRGQGGTVQNDGKNNTYCYVGGYQYNYYKVDFPSYGQGYVAVAYTQLMTAKSAFNNGDRVQTTVVPNLRASDGRKIGTVPANMKGTTVMMNGGGTMRYNPDGNTYTYVYVEFDNGQKGYVAEGLLRKV